MKRFVCIGGVLTTITVLFQSAPVFLPAVGLTLSPLSTLPIAIAAASNIFLGLAVFISSALILSMVSIQESIILLFTTGPLGIVIGAFIYRKKIIVSIISSSLTLFSGIIFLTYIINIFTFIDARKFSTSLTLLILFTFSFLYALIWNISLRKFINYLAIEKMN